MAAPLAMLAAFAGISKSTGDNDVLKRTGIIPGADLNLENRAFAGAALSLSQENAQLRADNDVLKKRLSTLEQQALSMYSAYSLRTPQGGRSTPMRLTTKAARMTRPSHFADATDVTPASTAQVIRDTYNPPLTAADGPPPVGQGVVEIDGREGIPARESDMDADELIERNFGDLDDIDSDLGLD